jgi:hypothetical protein
MSTILESLSLPVRILVSTSRGERLIDFGVPPADGSLDHPNNMRVVPLDDCLGPLTHWWIPLRLWQELWLIDRPPIWQENLGDVAVFKVSHLEIRGVDHGEAITVDLPDDGGMSVIATGAATDRVIVPIAQALRASGVEGRVEKTSGRELGPVRMRSMMFQRVAIRTASGTT